MKQVMTGTTLQCLRHWATSVSSVPHAVRALREWNPKIANQRTIDRWIKKGPLPEGERLLQLQAFLLLGGYRLAEHEMLPADMQLVRFEVGRSVLSLEDLTNRLGYRTKRHTLQMLVGKTKPMGRFREKFDTLVCELRKVSAPRVERPIEESKPSGVRKIVEHAITLLNSVAGLVETNSIAPHTFDSDRGHVQGAVKRICGAFGIEASFKTGVGTGIPLTSADLDVPTSSRRRST